VLTWRERECLLSEQPHRQFQEVMAFETSTWARPMPPRQRQALCTCVLSVRCPRVPAAPCNLGVHGSPTFSIPACSNLLCALGNENTQNTFHQDEINEQNHTTAPPPHLRYNTLPKPHHQLHYNNVSNNNNTNTTNTNIIQPSIPHRYTPQRTLTHYCVQQAT